MPELDLVEKKHMAAGEDLAAAATELEIGTPQIVSLNL